MTDFIYVSDSLDESAKFLTDKVQFGDGYSQYIPNGINNGLRSWSVTFSDRSLTDANAMVTFWRTRNGATSFSWRPQGFSSDIKVVCTQYSKPMQNRFLDGAFVYSLSATFEESPI